MTFLEERRSRLRRLTLPLSIFDIENLTGKTAVISNGDEIYSLPPSERICRLRQRYDSVGDIEGVPLVRRTPQGIEGLPSIIDEPDTFFLVANTVTASNPFDPRLLSANRLRLVQTSGCSYATQLISNWPVQ